MGLLHLIFFVSSCTESSHQPGTTENDKYLGQVETRTNSVCHPDFPVPCKQYTKSKIVNVNTCTVTINNTLVICPTGISIINTVYSHANTEGCDNIRNYWKSLYDNGRFSELRAAQNHLFRFVSNEVELSEPGSLEPQSFPCDNGITFQSDYIANTCLTVCLQMDPESSILYPKEVQCGMGCCIRTRSFCFSSDDFSLKTYTPQITASNIDCDPVPGPFCFSAINSLCGINCSRLL
jgi:hypothetical protein